MAKLNKYTLYKKDLSIKSSFFSKKTHLLTAIGAGIEYYDYSVFAFFSMIIGQQFFPVKSPAIATIIGFCLFSVGTLARIIGGALFSYIGDKHGRKTSFIYTVFFMTIPAFLISILPSYSKIGVFAPIFLIMLRIIQGVSAGGELPSAIAFISEHSDYKNKTFNCTILECGALTGLLFASSAQYILSLGLSQSALNIWGWRLAFFIGGILGIIGIYLRKNTTESPVFLKNKKDGIIAKNPLKLLFKEYMNLTIQCILICSFGTCFGLIFFTYLPNYLNINFGYELSAALKANSICIIITFFSVLLFGFISIKINKYKLFYTGCISFLIITYPIFFIFSNKSLISLYLSYSVIGIFSGLILSSFYSILGEIFPPIVRISGIAFGLNISSVLFGGFGAAICSILIEYTHNKKSPAFFVIFCILLTFVGLYFFKRNSIKNKPELIGEENSLI